MSKNKNKNQQQGENANQESGQQQSLQAKTHSHIVTQDDIDANPEAGLVLNEEIQVPVSEEDDRILWDEYQDFLNKRGSYANQSNEMREGLENVEGSKEAVDKKIADAQEEMKPAQSGAPNLGELKTDDQINEKREQGGTQEADAGRDEATKKSVLGDNAGPTPAPGMNLEDSALGRRRANWGADELNKR